MKKRYYFLFIVILLSAASLAAEIYLRLSAPQVVRSDSKNALLIESDPAFLIKYTADGKSIIPGANVIVRNHQLSHRDIPIRINSYGFRGPEIEAKKENEYRILVLGDSITWADYLLEDEIYHHQLYRLADETGKKTTVINGGVGDIGLQEMMNILTENGLQISPDLVVVAFYLNDSRPPWGFPGEISNRGVLRRYSRLAEFIYKEFHLMKWFAQTGKFRFEWFEMMDRIDWRGSADGFQALADAARFDWGAAWQDDSWKQVERHFGRLRELSRAHKFEVMIVVLPVYFQVYSDILDDRPQKKVAAIGAEMGFPVLDLLPVLRSMKDKELFYDHCHPLPATNGIMGLALKNFIYDNYFSASDKKAIAEH